MKKRGFACGITTNGILTVELGVHSWRAVNPEPEEYRHLLRFIRQKRTDTESPMEVTLALRLSL